MTGLQCDQFVCSIQIPANINWKCVICSRTNVVHICVTIFMIFYILTYLFLLHDHWFFYSSLAFHQSSIFLLFPLCVFIWYYSAITYFMPAFNFISCQYLFLWTLFFIFFLYFRNYFSHISLISSFNFTFSTLPHQETYTLSHACKVWFFNHPFTCYGMLIVFLTPPAPVSFSNTTPFIPMEMLMDSLVGMLPFICIPTTPYITLSTSWKF